LEEYLQLNVYRDMQMSYAHTELRDADSCEMSEEQAKEILERDKSECIYLHNANERTCDFLNSYFSQIPFNVTEYDKEKNVMQVSATSDVMKLIKNELTSRNFKYTPVYDPGIEV